MTALHRALTPSAPAGARHALALVLLTAAVAAASLVSGVGTARAAGPACLWAGGAHGQGTTVAAGGWRYSCGTDPVGGPYWYRGERVEQASTVANPGAIAHPAGQFSPGARQFGTDYNDYCVGAQRISGTDDVYQVVADHTGYLFWKAAAPIHEWRFDAGSGPQPSRRGISGCSDDSWPFF
ncbi:hypothetical protein [Nocardia sp. NBC_00416]|uniref:hypothetical protein n=1 Tax=Nocardia sp. NBC_00416 TaxID=2975991 RepID=UPI002E1C7C04